MRHIRCVSCGRDLYVESGTDDRGELVEDYTTPDGRSLEENERGEQVCSCGREVSGA